MVLAVGLELPKFSYPYPMATSSTTSAMWSRSIRTGEDQTLTFLPFGSAE